MVYPGLSIESSPPLSLYVKKFPYVYQNIKMIVTSILIMVAFSTGLAYLAFPRFLTYKRMKAAAVSVYSVFQKRA